MQYFIKRGNKVKGPINHEQLIAFAKQKKLTKSDLVGNSKDGSFQNLAKVWDSIKNSKPVPEIAVSLDSAPERKEDWMTSGVQQAKPVAGFKVKSNQTNRFKKAKTITAKTKRKPSQGQSKANNPIATQFERPVLISYWIAGAGLLLLAISPLFKWVNFGSGGMIGIAGDGKIVLGISIALIAAFVAVFIKRLWITVTFFVIQAWGIVVLFWMGTLFYRISTVTTTIQENMDGNMFAGAFSMMLSPGAGLYIALLGGSITAGAAGYFLVKLGLSPQRFRLFYASQAMSVFIGIMFALFLGSLSGVSGNSPTTAETSSLFEFGAEPKSKAEPLSRLMIGETYQSDGFSIKLFDAKIAQTVAKDFAGDLLTGKTPDLELLFTFINTDERKYLNFHQNQFVNYFRLKDDVDNTVRGIDFGIFNNPVNALSGSEDIAPGDHAKHAVYFSVPLPKTKFLILTVDLDCLGGEGKLEYKIPASEILRPDLIE